MGFLLAISVPILVVSPLVVVAVVLIRRQNSLSQQGQQHPLRMNENLNPERLQLVYRSGAWNGPRREIYRDTQTGVQYLVVGAGAYAAVTPILDRDGKPLVDQF